MKKVLKRINGKLFEFSIISCSRFLILLILVVMITATFIGCSQNNNADNASKSFENADNTEQETANNEFKLEWKATLYMPDSQHAYVLKEEKGMVYSGKGEAVQELPVDLKARFILEELINSGKTSIPSNTKVISVDLNGSELIINLSEEFEKEHVGGSTGISMTMGPIVLSLTDIDGVDKVSFKVEGKVLEEFKGHIELNRPFSRDDFKSLIK